MKGHMKKRSLQGGAVEGRKLVTHWKANAVISDDSTKFAAELERLLNECSAEGYTLAQLIPRPVDNGVVLVHQKHTTQDPEVTSVPGAN